MKLKNIGLVLLIASASLVSCGENKADHTHSYTYVKGVSAKCNKEGIKNYYICNECKALFDENKNEVKDLDALKIPATGVHTFDQEVVKDEYLKTPATCQGYAVYYKSCTCGVSSKDSVVPLTFTTKGNHILTHFEETEEYEEHYLCEICSKVFAKDKVTQLPAVPLKKEIRISPLYGKSNGKEYEPAINYLNVEDDPTTVNNEIAEYLYKAEKSSAFGSRDSSYKVTLNFDISVTCKAPLYIVFSKDDSFTNIEKTITIESLTQKSKEVYNLTPGTHYYKMYDSSEPKKESNLDFVTIEDGLRAINTADQVSNMRDVCSFESSYGKIKPGLVYRSAAWSGVGKSAEDIFKNDLKLKTEIDIRFNKSGEADHSTSEHPIEGINYKNIGLTDDYNSMLSHSDTIKNITTLFNSVLTDSNNFPLDYHCTSGADRTGFLGLLIDGVLGMSDEDIYRDYELTSFYISKRFRSTIKINGNDYSFDPSGECDLGSWFSRFGKLIDKLLMPTYKTADNTIASAVVNFLKTKCSVTDANLETFRNIMIER